MVAHIIYTHAPYKMQSSMNEATEDEMLAQAIAMSLETAAQHTTHPPTDNVTVQSPSHSIPTTCKAVEVPNTSAAPELGKLSEEASELAHVIMSREEPQQTQGGADLPPAVLMAREWQPNKECLELVLGMGISENAARRALFNTGNDSAELAISWVFENINDPALHDPFNPGALSSPLTQQQGGPVYHSYDNVTVGGQEALEMYIYKMVFVVNTELQMGAGKIAAQVGHATLALYHLLQTQPTWKEQCVKWEETVTTKIAVQGLNTHHLLELKHKAYELRLPNVIVHDAGKTQVEPGSLTVFAVFGKIAEVNEVTGTLKLL